MDLRVKRFLYYRLGMRRKRTIIWASRATYVFMALVVMGGSLLLSSFTPLFQNDRYELSDEVRRLIGEVRDDAMEYLRPTEDHSAYRFEVEEASQGTAEQTGRVADAYSASFSVKPKGGISVTEKTTQVPVRLIPKFYTGEGREIDGRMVYPFGKNQLIYSLKYNGLKEDIVVAEPGRDEQSYSFELVLPVGAEARLESNGGIGIYTAASELFGNMSYGSDEDKELVERAREAGEKNNLAITIPAPIIKDATGQEYTDRSEFKLGEKKQRQEEVAAAQDIPEEVQQKLQQKNTFNVYDLTIASRQLKGLRYPIAIDPTVTIPGAADFDGVEFGAGISPDYASGEIRRGELTGGTLAGWGSTNAPGNVALSGAAAHNGYIYLVGGDRDSGGTYATTVSYAAINSDGTLGSWNTTSSLNTGRRQHRVIIHNGHIYAIGGQTTGATEVATVEYAKINPSGTLGSWQSTVSLPEARTAFGLEAYNGYLYVIAGATSSVTNSVIYASLNASGTIASDSGCGSSWCSTTSTPNTRNWTTATAYNGWMYVVGGNGGGTIWTPSVIRAPINSDGTLGNWVDSSDLNTTRTVASIEIWNGYLYVMGGCSAGVTGFDCPGNVHLATVEYAPIHANGSLGTWRTTASFTTARYMHSSIAWNGRLYVIGGCATGSYCNFTNTVQYTSINSAGSLADGSWSSATDLPAAYSYGVTKAYNGYLYHIGGWSGSLGYLGTVRYAAINADGSLGSWTTSVNSLNTPRRFHGVAIYNGRMYVAGGQTSSTPTYTATIEYAVINSDGSVGSFSNTTTGLDASAARTRFGFAIYNDIVYQFGGADPTSNSTYRVSLDPTTGDITGSWSVNLMNLIHHSGTALIYNGFVYYVGGRHSSSIFTNVEYAPLESDGSVPLSNWITGTSYINADAAENAFIYNGHIYKVAADGASPIEFAPINIDGSVGTWKSTGVSTDIKRDANPYSGATEVNGHIYLVGGHNGTSHQSSAAYIPINNGGQGGATAFTNSTGVGNNRKNHASVAHNGFLYVLGGCTNANCTNTTSNTRYAPLNPDGTIGTWSASANHFSTARYNLYAWAHERQLCIAGGIDGSGNPLTDIQCGRISVGTPGTVGQPWVTDDTALPSTGQGASYAVHNNTLYVMGGASTPTTTHYASFTTDGLTYTDVSSFTSTATLPEGRYDAWSVVYKGYIYIMGGYTGSAYLRSVYFAPLNSDGSIGTWRVASSQLGAAVSQATRTNTFATNGYIYIAGGENASGFYNHVQYAAIGSGGDLGAWQTGVASGLANHGNYTAVQWNSSVYITSGQYTSNNTSGIARRATLQVIPRIGTISRYYDFDTQIRIGDLITRGVKQTGAVIGFRKVQNFDCGSNLWFAPLSVSNLEFGAANRVYLQSGGNTLVRCYLLTYALDDQQASVFPDVGNQTYISNFDVYYTANPGARLRGGRTFAEGANLGLQANPTTLEASLLTFGITTSNQSSYTTASVAPGANRVLLLAVSHSINSNTNPPPPSSVTGLGLTWEYITTERGGGTTSRALSLYRAQTGSNPPTPGTITINHASTQNSGGWSLVELSGAALGNNGADAIGTVDTGRTDAATINLDLGSSVNGSVTLVFANSNSNGVPITGTGTELAADEIISPTIVWSVRYSAIGEGAWVTTTGDGTTTQKAAIGVRILRGQ